MVVKSRKAEHAEMTRSALLRAARELFAERGYTSTPTEEIVQRARVTRGALYHHFKDKQSLFEAVFEEMEQEFANRIASASSDQLDPWERFRAGCEAFLDTSAEPAIQRVVFLDAPSVLGWEKWREIDAKYGLGLMRGALKAAMASGAIDEQAVEPLAHMLLGALVEGGMFIARATDMNAARAEAGSAFARLLRGLKEERV